MTRVPQSILAPVESTQRLFNSWGITYTHTHTNITCIIGDTHGGQLLDFRCVERNKCDLGNLEEFKISAQHLISSDYLKLKRPFGTTGAWWDILIRGSVLRRDPQGRSPSAVTHHLNKTKPCEMDIEEDICVDSV